MIQAGQTRRRPGLAARLCAPAQRDGRRARAMNPLGHADARLFETIGRGKGRAAVAGSSQTACHVFRQPLA